MTTSMITTQADASVPGVPDDSRAALMLRAPEWLWDTVAYFPAFAGVPALALGLFGLAGRGPRLLRRRPWLSALAAVGGTAILVKWQLERLLAEEPTYDVVRELEGIEIRRYTPRVVAETNVDDQPDWDEARSEGFRRLATYIFGGNTRKETMPMTSPVGVTGHAQGSERLAMTSPVTSRRTASGYVVTFVMPKERSLASLPEPTDPRVRLRKAKTERIAVLRFRGSYRAELIREKQDELLRRVHAAGLKTRGEPLFAGYDAPSTLPFLRRVEVWVPLV